MGLSFEETVEHTPRFRNALFNTERDVDVLEKRLSRLLELLIKRDEQNRQMLQTSKLINIEFEELMTSSTSSLKNPLKTYTSAMQHWHDSSERHNEQIRMVLIDPLYDFMQTDFKKVELRKQQYHTAVKDHKMCSEDYADCKQEDTVKLHAASQTLYNAHYNVTRLAGRYVLHLKTFFTKTDIFLTGQLSELITTYLSHHQLGSNIALEVESQRDASMAVLLDTKTKLESATTKLRDDLRVALSRTERAQTLKLLNLQLYDLNMKEEANKTAAKLKEFTSVEEKGVASQKVEGYLWVGEKSTFGHSWIRSWCTVKEGILTLLSEDKGEQRINLKLCQVKSDTYNVNRAFAFSLFSPVKPLILQALSSQEKETWVMVIHKEIANAISAQYSISDTNSVTDNNKNPRKDNILPLSVLRELQELPGNMLCADCNKKKPTWASLNLGVLICIECSGIHRGLGVQLSQVRSLTLDALSAEQIEMLREVGNSAANQIYEAELDADKSITTHAQRKEFISRKYVDLTFTASKHHDTIVESRKTGSQKTLAAVQKTRDTPSPSKTRNTPSPNNNSGTKS